MWLTRLGCLRAQLLWTYCVVAYLLHLTLCYYLFIVIIIMSHLMILYSYITTSVDHILKNVFLTDTVSGINVNGRLTWYVHLIGMLSCAIRISRGPHLCTHHRASWTYLPQVFTYVHLFNKIVESRFTISSPLFQKTGPRFTTAKIKSGEDSPCWFFSRSRFTFK